MSPTGVGGWVAVRTGGLLRRRLGRRWSGESILIRWRIGGRVGCEGRRGRRVFRGTRAVVGIVHYRLADVEGRWVGGCRDGR